MKKGTWFLDPDPEIEAVREGNVSAIIDGLLDDPESRANLEERLLERERLESRATTLYRFFDADGALLYVGITNRSPRRIQEHSQSKGWWSDVMSATFEHFPSRRTAEHAESKAIEGESPRYNIARPRPPLEPVSPLVIRRPYSPDHRYVKGVRPSMKRLVSSGDAWFTLEKQAKRHFGWSAAELVRRFEAGEIGRDDVRLSTVLPSLSCLELPVSEWGDGA